MRKKIFAIICSIIMIVCVFVGCAADFHENMSLSDTSESISSE